MDGCAAAGGRPGNEWEQQHGYSTRATHDLVDVDLCDLERRFYEDVYDERMELRHGRQESRREEEQIFNDFLSSTLAMPAAFDGHGGAGDVGDGMAGVRSQRGRGGAPSTSASAMPLSFRGMPHRLGHDDDDDDDDDDDYSVGEEELARAREEGARDEAKLKQLANQAKVVEKDDELFFSLYRGSVKDFSAACGRRDWSLLPRCTLPMQPAHLRAFRSSLWLQVAALTQLSMQTLVQATHSRHKDAADIARGVRARLETLQEMGDAVAASIGSGVGPRSGQRPASQVFFPVTITEAVVRGEIQNVGTDAGVLWSDAKSEKGRFYLAGPQLYADVLQGLLPTAGSDGEGRAYEYAGTVDASGGSKGTGSKVLAPCSRNCGLVPPVPGAGKKVAVGLQRPTSSSFFRTYTSIWDNPAIAGIRSFLSRVEDVEQVAAGPGGPGAGNEATPTLCDMQLPTIKELFRARPGDAHTGPAADALALGPAHGELCFHVNRALLPPLERCVNKGRNTLVFSRFEDKLLCIGKSLRFQRDNVGLRDHYFPTKGHKQVRDRYKNAVIRPKKNVEDVYTYRFEAVDEGDECAACLSAASVRGELMSPAVTNATASLHLHATDDFRDIDSGAHDRIGRDGELTPEEQARAAMLCFGRDWEAVRQNCDLLANKTDSALEVLYYRLIESKQSLALDAMNYDREEISDTESEGDEFDDEDDDEEDEEDEEEEVVNTEYETDEDFEQEVYRMLMNFDADAADYFGGDDDDDDKDYVLKKRKRAAS